MPHFSQYLWIFQEPRSLSSSSTERGADPLKIEDVVDNQQCEVSGCFSLIRYPTILSSILTTRKMKCSIVRGAKFGQLHPISLFRPGEQRGPPASAHSSSSHFFSDQRLGRGLVRETSWLPKDQGGSSQGGHWQLFFSSCFMTFCLKVIPDAVLYCTVSSCQKVLNLHQRDELHRSYC